MKEMPESRHGLIAAAAAGLLAALLYLPIIARMLETGYDYIVHMELAENMLHSGRIMTPHFLLQSAVSSLSSLVQVPVRTATASVILLAVAATALIITRNILTTLPRPCRSVPLAIALLLVAPPAVLFPLDRHLYLGYVSANVFHNPTMLLLKPLALLSFGYAVMAIDGSTVHLRRHLLYSFLLTVACALTKPSFTICILPALALLAAFGLRGRQTPDWRLVLAGFLVPAAIVLALQFRMTYTADQLQGVYGGKSGIILAPLEVMRSYSSWLSVKLLLSLSFPLAVLICHFREARENAELRLGWLTFSIGAAYTYLLAESGPRMFQGNFTWSAQISLFILFVSSVKFLLGRSTERTPSERKKFVFCSTLLSLHLIFGLAFYLSEYLQTERYW